VITHNPRKTSPQSQVARYLLNLGFVEVSPQSYSPYRRFVNLSFLGHYYFVSDEEVLSGHSLSKSQDVSAVVSEWLGGVRFVPSKTADELLAELN